MSDSIAERFVTALAEIRKMTDESDHPMRHEVYSLQASALEILSSSIQSAQNLSRLGRQMKRSFDDELKEAKKGGA